MKIRPLMLTPTFAKNVKAPGRYGDGRGGLGLSLLVRPALRGGFTKSCTQCVRIGGRPTSLGLGRYPVVTLAMARERALENARAIADGRDPRGGSPRSVPTFAKALETVIAIHAQNWKDRLGSEHQWRATLTTYAFPRIGSKPVDAVTTACRCRTAPSQSSTKPANCRTLAAHASAIRRSQSQATVRRGRQSPSQAAVAVRSRSLHARTGQAAHEATPVSCGSAASQDRSLSDAPCTR